MTNNPRALHEIARANINALAENLYARLPSGDYGRGDVRRVIRTLASEN